MKKIYYVILFSSLMQVSCDNVNERNQDNAELKDLKDSMMVHEQPNPYANAKIEFKVFSNDTTRDSSLHGYGYNIIIDGILYVHQPHIPAVSGNNGFHTIENAERAATLTVYKIKNNIMPPSVTAHELDSVGALN